MILPTIIVVYALIHQLDQAMHGPNRARLSEFEKLSKALAKIDMIPLSFNLCVFIRVDHEIIVVLYIDDLTTVGSR